MRLDNMWLQTTLNTPNISGVWQIKKWSLISLKAHQPRQGQSPLEDSPENFRDLSILADCDADKSIDAARKLVCLLYDQKGKLKEDHVDLSKLNRIDDATDRMYGNENTHPWCL
jgi:hypothetical protein